MIRLCVISVDTAGLEPATSIASTPLSALALCHLRAMCPVILFRITGWLNHARGGRAPFADAESAVSGSHKPRPPKFKLPGLSCPVTLGAGARCPRSATTDTVGAGSTAGGANFARLLRRLAAAVVVGLKDGAHPLPAAVAARRKELTPLSNHAFVRSMVKTRRHLRRLVEE